MVMGVSRVRVVAAARIEPTGPGRSNDKLREIRDPPRG